jgi:hypothetical protein
MKIKTVLIIAASVAALGLLVCGYIAYSTFAYSGSRALSRLTPEDQPYFVMYNQLQTGMTYDQAVAILGEPDRYAMGIRPTWLVNDSSLNQIAVYFQNGKLRKVRWMSIGRFIMEK